MAAYAALVSLMNLMEQMQNHPRHSFSFDKKQIESLREKAEFLLDFTESYNSHGGREEAEALERQIAPAAYAAVEVIESHIVDQIHGGSTLNGETSSCFLVDVQKVIEEMDSIKKMALKVKAERGSKDQLHTYSAPATSSKPLTSGKNTMVGFDDELIQLRDMLTRQHSGRQIIPIVGMGGIGKTTLTRNAYEHLHIKQHFDVCLWATISLEYSVEKILLDLLSCLGKSTGGTHGGTHELGEQLHKSLKGDRRYLIILDDMWNIEAWDEIQLFLPENGSGSSIVITTRLSNMATQLSSTLFRMKFLDEDKSWKLFCEKAFGEEDCPHELEEIGKKIVKKCRGLPLSIVVIGGHLRNSSRTKEYWVEFANYMNSILDSGEDHEQCLSILSLSYSHLPSYLKPCFLYIGNFPEDREIRVSILVKLWVAEGFLKLSVAQSLEEVAEVYLKDLVDRNLILAHKWSRNGKLKTCKIHDHLRDLCLTIAEKEKFRCDLKLSLLHLKSSLSDFRLLKIQFGGYEVVGKSGMVCLEAKSKQVYLRYLKSKIHCKKAFWRSTHSGPFPCLYLPSSVFLLWNLQTLIIKITRDVRIIAPSEIWEMPQLRHLLIRPNFCLPDPPPSDQQDDFVLHNLQTVLRVENFRLSEEVCKRMPNVKRLKLFSDGKASPSSYYCLHNLCCFKELKSLTCNFTRVSNWRDSALNLPSSLQKLSLRSRCLDWEDLTMIASSVPHLEVLKLNFWDSAIGQFEGEFPCLKSLTIWSGNVFNDWNAESSHFPVLENLTLKHYRSAEIPPGIGEIPTLRCIELEGCSATAAVPAIRILVEQEELGGEGFQLQIDQLRPEERFWEMVEEEGLTSNNLLLKYSHRTKAAFRMKTGS